MTSAASEPLDAGQRDDDPPEDRDAIPSRAVVVGVDGSERDVVVLEFAVAEAARAQAPLHLLMAHEIHAGLVGSWDAGFVPAGLDTELARASQATLARLAADVARSAPGLSVTTSDPWATPSQALLAAAEDARLVVVGTGRKGGLERAILGTTSLHTAMHAPCPVAVVGVDALRSGPVVVGVDGSRHSPRAAQWAAEAAAARGTSLTVVATWWLEVEGGVVITEEGTPEWDRVEARYREMVEKALGSVRTDHPDLVVDVVVTNARAVPALLEAAADGSLLVVGSRGRGGFTGMALGSVSHRVLQRATCPVVVTRGPREG